MFNSSELKMFSKIIGANFKRPSFPAKLGYITTYRCNLKCKICKIWKKDAADELGCGEIEKFFRHSNRFSWVGLTGGEPFLRDDICRIAEIVMSLCKELCVLHFATNGTLTEKIIDVAEDLIKHKNFKTKILFSISIDGKKDLHDLIRGIPGSWEKSIRTFIELKKMPRIEPRINITLSNHNMDAFEETFLSVKNVFPSLRFDDIGVNIFQKSSFYYSNQDLPDLELGYLVNNIDKILLIDKEAFSYNNFIRRLYLRSYKYFLSHKMPLFNCQALAFNCVIDPAGDVYPCAVFNMRLSNIKDFRYDLGAFWRSEVIKRLRKKCFYNDCPSCWSPCEAYSSILCGLIRKAVNIIKLF
jgi:MoaA/NifB/PqqE/SkfB family radical SAM enzyme